MSQRERFLGHRFYRALWQLYTRPQPPEPWVDGGNFPWQEPDFSRRMLAEHLEQGHGAASRNKEEIAWQIPRIWQWLALAPGQHLLDLTCGPGLYVVPLAQRGLNVVGVDISPANVAYAHRIAAAAHVPIRFIQADARHLCLAMGFDAAMILYGQFAVLPLVEAGALLRRLAALVRPSGLLLLELLSPDHIDRTPHSSWWYSDEGGLWGEFPFLHFGERSWDAEMEIAAERFFVINLETGSMREYRLSDQMYTPERLGSLAEKNGWQVISCYPAWNGLELYDADEWTVYLLKREDDGM